MENASASRVWDLTEGPVGKKLLAFFFPILFGMLFQQLYNTADAIIVGRFVGTDALAAVGGSASVIINLVIGFFTALPPAPRSSLPNAPGQRIMSASPAHCIPSLPFVWQSAQSLPQPPIFSPRGRFVW